MPPSACWPGGISPAASCARSSSIRGSTRTRWPRRSPSWSTSGLLNDARYAENYVSYHADRGEGPSGSRPDLKALELPGELIRAALDAGPGLESPRPRRPQCRRFGPEEPKTWPQKAKQGRFLQYRGFSGDQVRARRSAQTSIPTARSGRSRPPGTCHRHPVPAGAPEPASRSRCSLR